MDTPFFPAHVQTESAEEAYGKVLVNAGCTHPQRDPHDKRVIEEVRLGICRFHGSRTGLPGLPDSQEDVGGWDDYPFVPRPSSWDTDGDGMPDDWESKRHLNPQDASDGIQDRNGDGYTNLEEYLGWLVGEFPTPQDP